MSKINYKAMLISTETAQNYDLAGRVWYSTEHEGTVRIACDLVPATTVVSFDPPLDYTDVNYANEDFAKVAHFWLTAEQHNAYVGGRLALKEIIERQGVGGVVDHVVASSPPASRS